MLIEQGVIPLNITEKIGKKIKMVKGKMSYTEFAKAIEKETGVSIHHTTLQKYVTGSRAPSKKNIEAISKYSKRPVSWFFEEKENDLVYKLPKDILEFLNEKPDKILPYLKLFKKAREENIPPEALEDVMSAFERVKKANNYANIDKGKDKHDYEKDSVKQSR